MAVMKDEARWEAEPGPALLEITVGDLLDQRAREEPELLFIICRDADTGLDTRWTLAEFRQRVDAFAKGLVALGIAPGDKVGVLAANRPEWFIANFALPKIGAVLVTVNTQVRQRELAHILGEGELRALILQRVHRGNPFLEHLKALVPHIAGDRELVAGGVRPFPNFRHAILIGEGQGEPGTVAFDKICLDGATVDDTRLAQRQTAVKPADVWQIQFTSGTTGAPKGAMLTHFGTINNARVFGAAAGIRAGDRMVSSMPLFHTAGNIVELLGVLVHGASLVKAAAFEPGWMLRLIHEERPTILCAVPTMLIAMLGHPDFAAGKFDTSSLRLLIGGGVGSPVRVLQRLRDEFGVVAQLGFGMTELSPMVTCTLAEDTLERKSLTVGRPLPWIDVKVVSEGGRTCRHDEPGELLVRSFSGMAGYYRQPEATAKTIDADGWLHSGDLAAMESDGTVRIVGRLKDMIKRGGENVYPAEIENFLMLHPAVAQAQVVGVPDEYMGEEAAAFIQVRPAHAVTASDLERYCRANIARHKLPRYFRFVDSFPMTSSGKVLKYELKDMLIRELAAAA